MRIKHAPRIATRRSQRGAMLLIIILIFAVPIIFMAYIGFVLQPGIALVKDRMSQHQADYSALSLAYECANHTSDDNGWPAGGCRQLAEDNQVSTDLPNWPAHLAHTPQESAIERIALSAFQVVTMTNSAHAQNTNCRPPECISGTVSSDAEGRIKATVQGSNDSRIGRTDREIGYASEALVEVRSTEVVEEDTINTGIFRGFVGCEKLSVKGSSAIDSGLLHTGNEGVIKISGSATVDGSVHAYTDKDGHETIDIGSNPTINGEIYTNGIIKTTNGSYSANGDIYITVDTNNKSLRFSAEDGINFTGVKGDVYVKGEEEESGLVFDTPQEGPAGDKLELKGDSSLYIQGDFGVRQPVKIPGNLIVKGKIERKSGQIDETHLDVTGDVFFFSECIDFDICDGLVKTTEKASFNTDPFDYYNDYTVCSEPPINIDEFFGKYSDINDAQENSVDFNRGDYFRFDCLKLGTGQSPNNCHQIEGDLTVPQRRNIIFHVMDDFEMSGDDTSPKLDVGSTSSLTIMVEGKITINGGVISSSDAFVTTDADNNTRAQVMIISKGESTDDPDVTISGNGSIKGVIYAPKSKIAISGTSSMEGAIVAKELDITGTSTANPFKHAGELETINELGGVDINFSNKPFITK